MTVIEFFACAPIENMVSCFLLDPDKVVFVGSGNKEKRRMKAHAKLAARMGRITVFENKTVIKDSLESVVKCLEGIVDKEDECVFDLTGGDAVSLVAAGIVYQRYSDKKHIQMHKYDFKTGVLIDCDGDKTCFKTDESVMVSVDEYVTLHGGLITSRTIPSYLTAPDDLEILWELCKTYPSGWNREVSKFNEFISHASYYDNGLRVVINEDDERIRIRAYDQRKADAIGFMMKLSSKGLIYDLDLINGRFSFTYKNDFVKSSLGKAGNVLEFKMLSVAASAKNDDGSSVFYDCMSGVSLDWDGATTKDGKAFLGSVNEIDLIMMDHLSPVFVSCKNGDVDDSELYKLATVAGRFSSGHCKMVLVASDTQKTGLALEYFKQRALDMNIVFIDKVKDMTDDQLISALRNA